MRVNENYKIINVVDQQQDEDSVLKFWQRILQQRKLHKDIFVHGSYQVSDCDNEQTWTFVKQGKDGRAVLVVLNFSEEDAVIDVPVEYGNLTLSNITSDAERPEQRLEPFEGRIYMNRPI